MEITSRLTIEPRPVSLIQQEIDDIYEQIANVSSSDLAKYSELCSKKASLEIELRRAESPILKYNEGGGRRNLLSIPNMGY